MDIIVLKLKNLIIFLAATAASALPALATETSGGGDFVYRSFIVDQGTTQAMIDAKVTDANCYMPANIGAVGEAGWEGCRGMLIVNRNMIRYATAINGGQDKQVAAHGKNFTLGKSSNKIFTGQISDFSVLALGSSFNAEIGYWDTSNATSMSQMLGGAREFNQSIEDWDVSKVKYMHLMFQSATKFNQPIGNWDVSSVENMTMMFMDSYRFNQPLSSWDTSKVKTTIAMFSGAYAFNQSIENWNTSNVVQSYSMFRDATSFNQPLAEWDTSRISAMMNMFNGATKFNQPLNTWCVSLNSSLPSGFDAGTTAWLGGTATRPQWGTCPL